MKIISAEDCSDVDMFGQSIDLNFQLRQLPLLVDLPVLIKRHKVLNTIGLFSTLCMDHGDIEIYRSYI